MPPGLSNRDDRLRIQPEHALIPLTPLRATQAAQPGPLITTAGCAQPLTSSNGGCTYRLFRATSKRTANTTSPRPRASGTRSTSHRTGKTTRLQPTSAASLGNTLRMFVLLFPFALTSFAVEHHGQQAGHALDRGGWLKQRIAVKGAPLIVGNFIVSNLNG